jgi:hypothetical protein
VIARIIAVTIHYPQHARSRGLPYLEFPHVSKKMFCVALRFEIYLPRVFASGAGLSGT